MLKAKSKSTTRGLTKARLTRGKALVTVDGKNYSVPRHMLPQLEEQLDPHRIQEDEDSSDGSMALDDFFAAERDQYPQWAINLRGLRYREDLTQIEFAEKVGLSQSNLSAMENGRRTIGKDIAKRIATVFAVDYRRFL